MLMNGAAEVLSEVLCSRSEDDIAFTIRDLEDFYEEYRIQRHELSSSWCLSLPRGNNQVTMETQDEEVVQRKANAEVLLPQFALERVLNTGKHLFRLLQKAGAD